MRIKEENQSILQTEKDQKEVLQWGKWLLETRSIQKKDYAISIISYMSSFFGLSVAGPLAYDFGKTMASLIDEDLPSLQIILGLFFAVAALTTLGSLGGVTLSDKLSELVTSKQLPTLREKKLLRYSRNSASFLLAFFSALQFAFLTAIFIGGGLEISFIMAVFSFLIYMWFNKDAVDSVICDVETAIVEYFDPEYQREKALLTEQIAIASEQYYSMNESTIDWAYQIFDDVASFEDITNQFRILLQVDPTYSAIVLRTRQLNQYFNILKILFSYGGFAIGATVGYAYFDLSVEFFTWFLNYMGHGTDNSVLLNSLSILGCIANGALGAVGLKKRSEQFFSFCFDNLYRYIIYSTNPKIRKTISILGVSCSAVATTPVLFAVYSYIKHRHGYPYMLVLLIPTFLAPLAVRSEAFEKMLNRFVNFIRKSRSLMTREDKIDHLILTLNKLKADIPKISKNALITANTLFIKPRDIENEYLEKSEWLDNGETEFPSSLNGIIN